MFRVTVSHAGKRLNIQLAGFFNINSANSTLREIERSLPILKDSFDVVVDIRHINTVSDDVALTIKTGTSILANNGAKNIVRVVGSSEYAVTTFAMNSWSSPKADIYFVPTLHDADVKLKELNDISEKELEDEITDEFEI